MTFITSYLADKLDRKALLIDEWIEHKTISKHKLIYSSLDVRNSGYKIVPIDANLFPAGFNNLSSNSIKQAKNIVSSFLKSHKAESEEVIIIAESHTRNAYYVESLINLEQILSSFFFKVTFAHLGEEDISTSSPSGCSIQIASLGSIKLNNQIIILNNDLSEGATDLLKSLANTILPPFELGWFQRKKTKFFELYQELVNEFASEFDFDSFYLSSVVKNCSEINFKTSSGIECIALNAEKTLHLIGEKYKQHSIKLEPYVVIKSNSGTYGMSVMTAKSGEDVYQMNKKRRTKMNAGKGGVITSDVVIQEGIETIENYKGLIAESMIYSLAAKPLSLIYRTHDDRDSKSNLNSPGMKFYEMDSNCKNSEFTYHYLVAKLSNLALIREIETYPYK